MNTMDNGMCMNKATSTFGNGHAPRATLIAVLTACSLALAMPAHALINLRFTPVDLAAAATDIVQVAVGVPKDGVATAKVVRTLKGKLPAESITFDLSDTDDSLLDVFPKTNSVGVMLTGNFSAASATGDGPGSKPGAMILVGRQWFALAQKDGKWQIGKDQFDLNAVWAGSAAMLSDCLAYCLADRRADVPVTSGAKFVGDELLGNIPGKVTGIAVTGDGKVRILSEAGDRQWEFPAKKETKLETKTAAPKITELINDYDGDGLLDRLEARPNGPILFRNTGDSRFEDITADTGELDYHSRSKPDIVGASDCDVNQDGRPDVLITYGKNLCPLVFFNRGFGCFGLARELLLQDSELKGAKAIADGQQATAFTDVNGDGVPDLLAVAPNGDLWVLYTKSDKTPGPCVTVNAPAPTVVVAKEGPRSLGARQVTPGNPAVFWLLNPGPLDLEWKDAEGKAKKKRVIAVKPVKVDLAQ